MRDVLQLAVGQLGDVGQGAPDEVFDAAVEAGVGDVDTLGLLDGLGGVFPLVGHGEDGVGAFDGLAQGGGVVEVGLDGLDAFGL